MNVVVNGLMANYQKVGNGKVLVLLPGWGDTTTTFSKLAEELKGHYEVYVLDLPGFGGTQTPPSAWGLDDYADFVKSWVKKIDIRPTAIIGHSYGGAVAIVGVSNGLETDKLVLIASAGIRDKRRLRKRVFKSITKAGKIPLYVLPSTKRQKVKERFYKSIGSDLMLLPHMEQTYRRIIKEDVRSAATRIKIPTLLIYGTMDRDTPASDGRSLSESITGSRLEVIDSGHFLHQDQPRKVAGLVEKFLEEDRQNA